MDRVYRQSQCGHRCGLSCPQSLSRCGHRSGLNRVYSGSGLDQISTSQSNAWLWLKLFSPSGCRYSTAKPMTLSPMTLALASHVESCCRDLCLSKHLATDSAGSFPCALRFDEGFVAFNFCFHFVLNLVFSVPCSLGRWYRPRYSTTEEKNATGNGREFFSNEIWFYAEFQHRGMPFPHKRKAESMNTWYFTSFRHFPLPKKILPFNLNPPVMPLVEWLIAYVLKTKITRW